MREIFRPSRSQTLAGLVLTLAPALGLFAWAAIGDHDTGEQLLIVCLGAGALALAFYVYRLQRWRLIVCVNGIMQVNAWGAEKLAWSDVTSVVHVRVRILNAEDTYEVKVIGQTRAIVIRPINLGPSEYRHYMFFLVIEEARERGIPIREEYYSPD